ncbi:hypothetical protein GJ496_010872 [Pomphorhynchus laevis]|nr:hypothetical protein GJ496_010872 [Pomphorhynchus laevis]
MLRRNRIPWKICTNINVVNSTTSNVIYQRASNVIIMDKSSWNRIPETKRPLFHRWNIVISRNLKAHGHPEMICKNLKDAIIWINNNPCGYAIETVFVCGEPKMIEEAMRMCNIGIIFCVSLFADFKCDKILKIDWSEFRELDHNDFELQRYKRFRKAMCLGKHEENNVHFRFRCFKPIVYDVEDDSM